MLSNNSPEFSFIGIEEVEIITADTLNDMPSHTASPAELWDSLSEKHSGDKQRMVEDVEPLIKDLLEKGRADFAMEFAIYTINKKEVQCFAFETITTLARELVQQNFALKNNLKFIHLLEQQTFKYGDPLIAFVYMAEAYGYRDKKESYEFLAAILEIYCPRAAEITISAVVHSLAEAMHKAERPMETHIIKDLFSKTPKEWHAALFKEIEAFVPDKLLTLVPHTTDACAKLKNDVMIHAAVKTAQIKSEEKENKDILPKNAITPNVVSSISLGFMKNTKMNKKNKKQNFTRDRSNNQCKMLIKK
ncbi:MAG: hypothetical protein ABI370_06495 [Gammaproteobacteria bacterium]